MLSHKSPIPPPTPRKTVLKEIKGKKDVGSLSNTSVRIPVDLFKFVHKLVGVSNLKIPRIASFF